MWEEREKKILEFWTGFYRKDAAHPDYCYTWASNKAYLDMNRTMTFREVTTSAAGHREENQAIEKNRRDWREEGTKVIRDAVQKLGSACDFYTWHKGVCDELIAIYGEDKLVEKDGNKRTNTGKKLTYGQAQKWLNMTLKYLWLLSRLSFTAFPEADIILKNETKLHVPLDSYILRYVAGEKGAKNQLAHAPSNYKTIGTAWSKINDYDEYKRYQSELEKEIKKHCDVPLDWELEHWHKALKLYGTLGDA